MNTILDNIKKINHPEYFTEYFVYIVIFIFFLIVTILLFKISEKKYIVNEYKKNIDIFQSKYPLAYTNINDTKLFKDLIIFGAFNCCNIKDYKYSRAYVDLVGIESSINIMGAICLDLQVFLNNNELIVASSTNNVSSNYKETINSIPLYQVFEKINDNYNSSSPDFIVLHIRLMSNNPMAYIKLISLYKSYFDDMRLRTPNIIDYNNNNCMHKTDYATLKGKIILFIMPINGKYNLIYNMDRDEKIYINCLTILKKKSNHIKAVIDSIVSDPDDNNTDYDDYKLKFAVVIDHTSTQGESTSNHIHLYIPSNHDKDNDFNGLKKIIQKQSDSDYFNIICLKYQYITKDKHDEFDDLMNIFYDSYGKYYKILNK